MNEDKIFEIMKTVIFELIPHQRNKTITIEDSLRDLGANSIDRAEIIIRTMEELNLKIPMVKFANAKNIKEIMSVYLESSNSR